MAEGGEGEEEIQFLRTVSPTCFPIWEGNLLWLLERSLGKGWVGGSGGEFPEQRGEKLDNVLTI